MLTLGAALLCTHASQSPDSFAYGREGRFFVIFRLVEVAPFSPHCKLFMYELARTLCNSISLLLLINETSIEDRLVTRTD